MRPTKGESAVTESEKMTDKESEKRDEARAEMLTEALPYIRRFAGRVVLIKFGGSILEDDALRRSFAKDIALLRCVGILPVIVHGGGKEITRWMQKFGKESKFVDGLRYSDLETVEVAEMVLSGRVNKALVSEISRAGAKAVGISGRDGGTILARRILEPDYGFVGDIESCDTEIIRSLFTANVVPVVSSVSESASGEVLNVNADSAASALAIALDALKLIYMTDVDGLRLDGEIVSELEYEEARQLLEHPDVQGGMKPKLQNAVEAVRSRVEHVHILNGNRPHAVLLELFTDSGVGTKLSYTRSRSQR